MTDFVDISTLPTHSVPTMGRKDSTPMPCKGLYNWREANEKFGFKGASVFSVPLHINMQLPEGHYYPMVVWFRNPEDAAYVLVHFDKDYLLERFVKEWADNLGWEPVPQTFYDFASAMADHVNNRAKNEALSKVRQHAKELSVLFPHKTEQQWYESLIAESEITDSEDEKIQLPSEKNLPVEDLKPVVATNARGNGKSKS